MITACINKSGIEAIMKACNTSGIECRSCNRKFVQFSEVENGEESEVHISCTSCGQNFAILSVINDDIKPACQAKHSSAPCECECSGK